jgi:hypothetical protein
MKTELLSLIAAVSALLTLAGDVIAAPGAESSKPKNSVGEATAVKSTRPECITKLSKAKSFDSGEQGEGARSPNYTAYAEASGMISALETKDLEWLLANGTPAGKLYGAVLLKQTGRVGDNDSFKKLEKDTRKVAYLSGCKGFETSVGEVARGFMKDGYFMNFKISMFCKMKAPIKEK